MTPSHTESLVADGSQHGPSVPDPVEPNPYLAPRGNFVDGTWVLSHTGRTLPVDEPATGETIASIQRSDAQDVERAIAAARRSYRDGRWSRLAPSERGRRLWRLAGLVRDDLERLAEAETRDSGKPIREAREDVTASAEIFEYYAGLASKIFGQTADLPNGQYGMTMRNPVGVVGAITPWNFPLLIAALKVAPALACGNSVVLKPSNLTSLTSLALAGLALEAEVPAGVLNVVCGTGEEVGFPLASHPDVDVLAFTGGIDAGRRVMAARAEWARPVQLELGGKSPNLVFADADLDVAIPGAAFAIFYNQGENCNAGSRILVDATIAGEFVERLIQFTNQIRVLPPLDERSQLGTLISQEHLRRVADYVALGLSEGASLLTGGEQITGAPFGDGHFYRPTVLGSVVPTSRVFREEIFGPVVTVTTFSTEDEAIDLANATDYGLAAGIWTTDLARMMRCAQRIETGYVWINTFNTTPVEAPFGGTKASGFGRDMGPQAIDNYTYWKTVAIAVERFSNYYGPSSVSQVGADQ